MPKACFSIVQLGPRFVLITTLFDAHTSCSCLGSKRTAIQWKPCQLCCIHWFIEATRPCHGSWYAPHYTYPKLSIPNCYQTCQAVVILPTDTKLTAKRFLLHLSFLSLCPIKLERMDILTMINWSTLLDSSVPALLLLEHLHTLENGNMTACVRYMNARCAVVNFRIGC